MKQQNTQLFTDLGKILRKISKEQKIIKIKTHGDLRALGFNSSFAGRLQVSKFISNLSFFAQNDETREELEKLRIAFNDAGLLNYKLSSHRKFERNDDYEIAFLLGIMKN
ncbi:hypothetical protein [Aminipila sp.]|uniref:hypothetical protein n=1 Tax=Aminipila sp. TaxID=2060095 RepID=UPI00289B66C6|nr:hypothetical protein [Aminipila sp.]